MEPMTLVLTPWMTPHKVVNWQRAVMQQYLDKIRVIAVYEEIISSPSQSFGIPAVVVLKRHVNTHKKGVKFSRINVFTRDHFKCQYCGTRKVMKELNYDHVIPRVQGGKTVWENIVTSCYPCNTRKDKKTPQQAGMKLLSKPHRPDSLPMTAPIVHLRQIPEEWKFYLPDPNSIILSQTG
jgi:5-methylcytosine-specific restriction endonuclease McrA